MEQLRVQLVVGTTGSGTTSGGTTGGEFTTGEISVVPAIPMVLPR
jgi:hypothetical protein